MILRSFALAAIVLAHFTPTAAGADHGTGNGTFASDTATISVWATDHTEGESYGAGDPDGPGRWRIRVTLDEDAGAILGSTPIYCVVLVDGVAVDLGKQYTVDTIDVQTGQVVRTHKRCEPLNPTNLPTSALPPPLPKPPTFGEIWEAAQIQAPTIGLNPQGEGVTGLRTRAWAIGPDSVTVTASVRGYTATGTAVRTGYRFAFGDGSGVVHTNGPGSATTPAATRRYQWKGAYSIQVGSLWTATVTVSGPGIPTTTTNLGEAILVAKHRYSVVEVRSQIIR